MSQFVKSLILCVVTSIFSLITIHGQKENTEAFKTSMISQIGTDFKNHEKTKLFAFLHRTKHEDPNYSLFVNTDSPISDKKATFASLKTPAMIVAAPVNKDTTVISVNNSFHIDTADVKKIETYVEIAEHMVPANSKLHYWLTIIAGLCPLVIAIIHFIQVVFIQSKNKDSQNKQAK
jgi:hypothetical protein